MTDAETRAEAKQRQEWSRATQYAYGVLPDQPRLVRWLREAARRVRIRR